MWRNRIYALIIRRILGPYLTPKSKRNLQETLNISLRQGRVTLHSIELDGRVLTDKLLKKSIEDEVQNFYTRKIRVKNVSIDELNISLFLVYDEDENDDHIHQNGDNHESGGYDNTTGAKLVAKVELNGVHVQIELDSSSSSTSSTSSSTSSRKRRDTTGGTKSTEPKSTPLKIEKNPTSSPSPSSSSGFLQSYIQAALDSLKLTLDVQNLTIEIMAATSSSLAEEDQINKPSLPTIKSSSSWIALRLSSLSYKDSTLPPPPPSTSASIDSAENSRIGVGGFSDEENSTLRPSSSTIKSIVILGKEICFHQLWIDVGSSHHTTQEILRFDGYATMITTIMKNISTPITTELFPISSNEQNSMERHLEIALDDFLDVQINPTNIKVIRDLLVPVEDGKNVNPSNKPNEISAVQISLDDETDQRKSNKSYFSDEEDMFEDDDDDDDEQDIGLLAHILQQQQVESSSYMSSPQNDTFHANQESLNQPSPLEVEGFFHTNQEGYSHYCKLASSLQMENRENNLDNSVENINCSSDCPKTDSMTTTISFYLKEMLLKVQLNSYQCDSNIFDKQLSDLVSCESDTTGTLMFSLVDINAVMNQIPYKEQTNLSFDLNRAKIYYEGNANTMQKYNLFQFVQYSKEPEKESPPQSDLVVSVKYSTWTQADSKESDLYLTLNPILITFRQEIFAMLAESYRDFIHSDTGNRVNLPSDDSSGTSSIQKMSNRLQVECCYISFEVPLTLDARRNVDVTDNLDKLFTRCGYLCGSYNPISSPTIALTMTDLDLNSSKTNIESVESDRELQLVVENTILSLLAPLNDGTNERTECLKFDFLSIDSETQIDPDATVKVQYSHTPSVKSKQEAFKKQRAKSFFPTVVPLALVKASQQFNDKDYQESADGNGLVNLNCKRSLRGTDPQSRMLREASKCEKNILVHVPSIAIDLSVNEKNALLHLISLAFSSNADFNRKNPETVESTNNLNKASDPMGFSFRCNQLTLSLHQDINQTEQKGGDYLQLIAFDGLNIYCLKNARGVRHCRFLTEDITFYEIENTPKDVNYPALSRVAGMCEMLRKRRFDRSNVIHSNAIFFRTKLSHPLSPKTPAILIDLITKRQEDCYGDVESSVHISLYDLTFRHNLESYWVDRLKVFCESHLDQNNEQVKKSNDESSKVTNIFCTVSDCNFDYSSPISFNKSSRTIVRMGELRITSNLISPPGPVQTCKVSIGDVSVHLSNKRGGYEEENARLSCANLIMMPELIHLKRKTALSHSYDDALFQLDFIAIASLDYLEGTFSIESDSNSGKKHENLLSRVPSPADRTLTLSVGKLCIFACKDSFDHFTSTINELILKLTMPSKEELDIMRQNYFAKSSMKDEQLSAHIKEDLVPVKGQSCEEGSLSLNDVMNDGLFSNDEMDDNLSNLDTLEEEASTFLQLNRERNISDSIEKENVNEGDNAHEVINDFYKYDDNPSPSQQSSCFQEGEMTDCWTAIDHPWQDDPCIPDGQEQAAQWYVCGDDKADEEDIIPQLKPSSGTVIVEGNILNGRQPRIFNRHIPISVVTDPLSGGDMGASMFAGTERICVKMRIVVTEMNFLCRLLDGYDWPNIVSKPKDLNTKSKLLGNLMGDDDDSQGLFSHEEDVNRTTEIKQRKPRDAERYFQFSFSGLKMRLDSFHTNEDHFLSSCLEMKLNDINLIETISSDKLVKLLGEWVNEDDHPRDSNDGLLMMKLVSLYPETKFAADGKLMGNEGHAVVEFLPVRFFIHQIALRFIRKFFRSDDLDATDDVNSDKDDIDSPPDMFFPTFRVKPFNIKVDYKPLEVDRTALKDGSYIQLLNLLPLEDMILRLNGVELRNLTGWGPVISELACKWLQDVSSTQMHKFLTRTTPLHPLANVGDGMKNFVLVPLKEYRQKGDVKKALRKSTSKLVGVVAYEALSVGAKLTGYAAKKLNKGKKRLLSSSSSSSSSLPSDQPPSSQLSSSLSSSAQTSLSSITSTTSKPISAIPRNMCDVSDRAMQSLSRGLKEANAKIIIIPYREYQKTGTKGAMKKVVRGIPVAVCAPLSGAVEALSHGLYGASNSLRPDLFEEREASKRFHDEDL